VIQITNIETTSQKRISSIYDFVAKLDVTNTQNISLHFERTFNDILSIFFDKWKCKLIYVLYNVEISSIWELSNHFNLCYNYRKDMNTILMDLETKNIVEEIYSDTVECKTLRKVWEILHPNGKRTYRKTKLFKLSDDFKSVFELFLDEVYSKYIYRSEYLNIEIRKISFHKIYNEIIGKEKQSLVLDENCIGRCFKCNQPISKDSTEYMNIYEGVVHKTCFKNTPQKEAITWKQKHK